MDDSAIVFRNLEKRYPRAWRRKEVEAVRNLDFAVCRGEAFGFVGPNGAGKSSTIRMLMGLSRPTAGEISIFDVDAGLPSARKGVGYVPENPILYDNLTPREIMAMGIRLHGSGAKPEAQKHIDFWLERTGLMSVADAPIRSFSKGMTQRIAIAQALVISPKMLVLDEPLSGLDPIGRHDVVDMLAEYKQGGGTIFFTSHVLHDVERLADRFGLIHKGTLLSVTSPSQISADSDTLLVRSVGAARVANMREESPGRWSCECTRAQLWGVLETLRIGGHTLIEVRPTLSLERVFMKLVGKDHFSS